MPRSPKTSGWILFGLGAAVLGIGLTMAWLLVPSREAPAVFADASSAAEVEDGSSSKPAEPLPAEDVLRTRTRTARNENELVAALNAYAASKEACWDSKLLSDLAVAQDSPVVRRKAFAVALDLAQTAGRAAEIETLKGGVQNPHSDVVRDAVRACRDHPHYELFENLRGVVESGGPERCLAIEALAFMDDPEAQALVLETARSEQLPRADRIQAVSLLARSNLDEAVEYLNQLARGDDEVLRKFAAEAWSIRSQQ